MGLNRIIGHEAITERFSDLIRHNRLSHGYIFEGLAGVGKMTTAIELAKDIFCAEDCNGQCVGCGACKKIEGGNHPDFMIIEPEGKSIKNKQVEEFQNYIKIKPYESTMKIVIIDQANTMTVSAQNRILKTLEEPPAYCLIILIVETAKSLLETVQSRCQTVTFNRIHKEKVSGYLVDHMAIEPSMAKVYSNFSDGSMGRAIASATSESFQKHREVTADFIMSIHEDDLVQTYELMNYFIENKDEIVLLIDLMILWYRDLMFYSLSVEKQRILNLDRMEQLKACSYRVNHVKLIKYIELLEKAKQSLKRSVNLNAVLEGLIINIQEV